MTTELVPIASNQSHFLLECDPAKHVFLLDKLLIVSDRDKHFNTTVNLSLLLLRPFSSCRQQGAHQNGVDVSAHLLTSTSSTCHIFNSGEWAFHQPFCFEHKRENVVFLICGQPVINPKSVVIVHVASLLKSCKHFWKIHCKHTVDEYIFSSIWFYSVPLFYLIVKGHSWLRE